MPLPELIELIERFAHHLGRHASGATRTGYVRNLRQCLEHLKEDLGREPVLEDFSRPRLQDYLDALPDQAPTVQRKCFALKKFLRYCVEMEELPIQDSGRALRAPPLPRPKVKFLSVEQAAQLMEAPTSRGDGVQQVRDAGLLQALYGGGMRASEALDLDLESLLLDTPRPGHTTIRVWGKGQKERVIVVNGRTDAALRRYLARRDELVDPERPCRAVFLSTETGGRLSRRRLLALVKGYAAALGFKCYPHLLRHSCATHMLWRGSPLRAVQAYLGHSDPAVTARYAHVDVEHLRRECADRHPQGRDPEPAACAAPATVPALLAQAIGLFRQVLALLQPGEGPVLPLGPWGSPQPVPS